MEYEVYAPADAFPVEPEEHRVPARVVPAGRDVYAVLNATARTYQETRAADLAGRFAACRWVYFKRPRRDLVSKRQMDPRAVTDARAESWLACCVAAGRELPTKLDYRRIGVNPMRPEEQHAKAETVDPLFAYGVWVALDWLLGRRADPGLDPASYRADARRHWGRLRELADAQVAPEPVSA